MRVCFGGHWIHVCICVHVCTYPNSSICTCCVCVHACVCVRYHIFHSPFSPALSAHPALLAPTSRQILLLRQMLLSKKIFYQHLVFVASVCILTVTSCYCLHIFLHARFTSRSSPCLLLPHGAAHAHKLMPKPTLYNLHR